MRKCLDLFLLHFAKAFRLAFLRSCSLICTCKKENPRVSEVIYGIVRYIRGRMRFFAGPSKMELLLLFPFLMGMVERDIFRDDTFHR